MNNESYSGEFKQGKMHGYGIKIYASGNRYEGFWLFDQKSLNGSFNWTNGNRYKGAWLQNSINGNGSFYWINGDKLVTVMNTKNPYFTSNDEYFIGIEGMRI